jgi:hypothetical protein
VGLRNENRPTVNRAACLRRGAALARAGILVRLLLRKVPRLKPEDAFLGTTGPRAGRLEKSPDEAISLNGNRPAVNRAALHG